MRQKDNPATGPAQGMSANATIPVSSTRKAARVAAERAVYIVTLSTITRIERESFNSGCAEIWARRDTVHIRIEIVASLNSSEMAANQRDVFTRAENIQAGEENDYKAAIISKHRNAHQSGTVEYDGEILRS